jgi:hypothetical protein
VTNATDAKEIALYYLGVKNMSMDKKNISRNIIIAKSILELGYPMDSIIIAIDLNVDKMYSLSFIKFVIEETHNAIYAKAKELEIKNALERINSTKQIYVESESDGENRNKEKLERLANISRLRKTTNNDLFKQ